MEEAEKEENAETREEKQEAGENIQQWERVDIRVMKPKLKEIRESLIWKKLEKEGMSVKRGKEENKLSRANLEDGRSQTETKRGVTEYAGITRIRPTSTRACYTDDVMRKNGGDEDKARRTGTTGLIRPRSVEEGLANHKRRTAPSLASTRADRADYVVPTHMVK